MKANTLLIISLVMCGAAIAFGQAAPNLATPTTAGVSLPTAPTVAAVVAPSPGKELYGFGWPDWFRDLAHPSKMEISPQGGELSLVYWGESPADLEVQRVEVNILSTLDSHQYAIEGNIRYTKVAPGSYLEMWSYFAPEKPGDAPTAYVTRTLADNGLMARLEGDGGDFNTTSYPAMFRRFQIPFDFNNAKTHLQEVILKLHLAGGYGTNLQFDNVKFVQYPNGYFPASVASVSTLSPVAIPPPPSKPVSDGAELFSEGQSLMNLTADNAWSSFDAVEGQPDVMKPRVIGRTHLWEISYPPVTEGAFAVVGEIRYDNVGDGFLEASCGWTPVNEPNRFTLISTFRADQFQGPFGRLNGTSGWRTFWLPCGPIPIDPQVASAPVKLKSLDIDLALAGKGSVYLRNVKLVQCPGGFPKSWTPPGVVMPNPQIQYPSPPPILSSAQNSASIDRKSFLAGVATTCIALLLGGGIIYISRYWQRRHHERELRRIASFDS